jgi:transcriptional regulator with XRE-family HTH domain
MDNPHDEVKRLLKRIGMRNVDLAKEMGVSPSQVTLWRQGRCPSLAYWFKLQALAEKTEEAA